MVHIDGFRALPYALLFYSFINFSSFSLRTFTDDDLREYREKVEAMFHHAYENYLSNAFPFDELKPLSCHGVDTWGSFSLTLIDALDTLAVMHNFTEFRRVVNQLISTADFNINVNVSVFETNIRVVGGLISAHLLSYKAGIDLEPGWPCSGPLLQLAETVARRLLPAFETKTGMPYGTVNLRYGVPPGETPVTCTAGVSTFVVEFGTLSRLTGDPIFEQVAQRALDALWERRSSLGMVGNHINVQEGKWTALDAGIGGGVDSYYEYLLKGAILFQDTKLMKMFREYQQVITKYMRRDDWHFWVSMGSGQVTMPVFQSLESFWPGLLSLVGENKQALKTLYNYHQVWKQYGFTPEFYDVSHNHVKREGYPLRPELIESVMYLYHATKDPNLLEIGVDILESIEYSARTECGYATVKSVIDHRIEDRMESFFLAETTKYLYLLFDPDNFIHNNGSCGQMVRTTGGDCFLGTGGYVFNTEAHPIDVAAVYCCSADQKEHDALLQNFKKTMDLHILLNINERGDFLHVFKHNQKKKRYLKMNTFDNFVEDLNFDSDIKIKTISLETQYSHESSIADKSDDIVYASKEKNKKYKEFLKKANEIDSIDTPDDTLWTESQNTVLPDLLSVSAEKSSNNKVKEVSAVSSHKPEHLSRYSSTKGDCKLKAPLTNEKIKDPHIIWHKKYDNKKEKVNENKKSIFSEFDFSLEERLEDDDDMPLFDRSFPTISSEAADITFKDLALNDSIIEDFIQKTNNRKSNFFSGAYAKPIQSVQNISLSNIINLNINVSSDLFEPINNYDILLCPAQPYKSRLNMMGEIFNADL